MDLLENICVNQDYFICSLFFTKGLGEELNKNRNDMFCLPGISVMVGVVTTMLTF